MTYFPPSLHSMLLSALLARHPELLAPPKPAKDFVREPYTPPTEPEGWRAEFEMLCLHCDRFGSCEIIEGMIEMKDGAPWPEGGWVTDPGAGVTCLSYKAKARPPLPRQQLRAIARTPEERLPPVCGGCAARKGSEASVSLHTQRDFKASVENRSVFACHEDPEHQRQCGGWCRAIKARAGK